MQFNCPLSTQKADRLISVIDLKANCKAVDIGCGEGAFLTRMQRVSSADCLGIDISSSCIAIANESTRQQRAGNRLQFLLANIEEVELERSYFDLAVCMGSTHAFGIAETAYPNALSRMKDLVKPNGLILIGEGYWKRIPEQAYLEFIGEPVGIYNTHEENIQVAESHGLVPLYALVSNQDEWDDFEWKHLTKAERLAISEPDIEEHKTMLERTRTWNKYYRKFGRSTMGFGFYLYRKPE